MTARHAAVLGRPVAHSLSPILHRAAYAHLGLDWTYDAIDCGVDELAAVLASRSDWAGLSCTMPLKRVALDIAAQVRPDARAAGAANTLLPSAGGWIADNTDVRGLVDAVRSIEPGVDVTVLGAGGTAQAVVVAIARLGVARCAVLVRDERRATELRATADRVGLALDVGPLAVDSNALDAGLVVSTLPAGTADALATHPWHAEQTVLDVVYDPWPTALASAAHAVGATVISGASVLLHQAAGQVELMTDRPAPLEAMRAALAAAAPGCGV